MSKYLFLIPVGIVVSLGGFVAFWCPIVKTLSLAGRQRLAHYRVPRSLGWPHTTLSLAKLGGIRYRNAIKAGAQAEGLVLESMFMFRIGHPPLLIPWSAIGPVLTGKPFWNTCYTASIRTENGGSISFLFSSERLASEVAAWRWLGR